MENPYASVSTETMRHSAIPGVATLSTAFVLTAVLDEGCFFWGNVYFKNWWHTAFLPLSIVIWTLFTLFIWMLAWIRIKQLRFSAPNELPLSAATLAFAVAPAIMMFVTFKLRLILVHESMFFIVLLTVLTQTLGIALTSKGSPSNRALIGTGGMLSSVIGCGVGYLHVWVMIWAY